jgi:fumarate reductase subunit C
VNNQLVVSVNHNVVNVKNKPITVLNVVNLDLLTLNHTVHVLTVSSKMRNSSVKNADIDVKPVKTTNINVLPVMVSEHQFLNVHVQPDTMMMVNKEIV